MVEGFAAAARGGDEDLEVIDDLVLTGKVSKRERPEGPVDFLLGVRKMVGGAVEDSFAHCGKNEGCGRYFRRRWVTPKE